jgi:N utilization substance protein A
MVVNELKGEKIDVVPWSQEAAPFVANALQPAKVKEVRIDADTQTALVIVPDYQLSLAIGKEGQNARLAARLTGWRIDIKSETQIAEDDRAPAPAAPAPAAPATPVAVEPAAEPAAAPAPESAPPAEAESAPPAEAESAPTQSADAISTAEAGSETETEAAEPSGE